MNSQKDKLRWPFEDWLPAVIKGTFRMIKKWNRDTADAETPISVEALFIHISNYWNSDGGSWEICFPPKEWTRLSERRRKKAIEKELERMVQCGEVEEFSEKPHAEKRWKLKN
jgi:hypothetical protein